MNLLLSPKTKLNFENQLPAIKKRNENTKRKKIISPLLKEEKAKTIILEGSVKIKDCSTQNKLEVKHPIILSVILSNKPEGSQRTKKKKTKN
ncbi:hypothetical protein CEXT_439251 [Caerostris extrusa]|uniref:Uncharacterized protein n=1 Tax=Caerostris extrusa TaxID=172846 RepID=A0AAV4N102_CAEEX|nr:hypothetical protein CEXT_439251 [Caerostris extrusa]